MSLPHVDRDDALRSHQSERSGYWTAIPFQNEILKADPSVRRVASSFDTFGGPHTHITMYGIRHGSRTLNRTFDAIADAFDEAFDFVAKNPRRAAEIFVAYTKSKEAPGLHLRYHEGERGELRSRPEGIHEARAIHAVREDHSGCSGKLEGPVLRERAQARRKLIAAEAHHQLETSMAAVVITEFMDAGIAGDLAKDFGGVYDPTLVDRRDEIKSMLGDCRASSREKPHAGRR